MTLGERIHLLRRRLGWTQQELGQHAQINKNTIARLERDEIRDPGSQMILRLARVLEVTTDHLLGRTEEGDGGQMVPAGVELMEADPTPGGRAPVSTGRGP